MSTRTGTSKVSPASRWTVSDWAEVIDDSVPAGVIVTSCPSSPSLDKRSESPAALPVDDVTRSGNSVAVTAIC